MDSPNRGDNYLVLEYKYFNIFYHHLGEDEYVTGTNMGGIRIFEHKDATIWRVKRLSDDTEFVVGDKSHHKDSPDKNIITITKFFISPDKRMIVQGNVYGYEQKLAWYMDIVTKIHPVKTH